MKKRNRLPKYTVPFLVILTLILAGDWCLFVIFKDTFLFPFEHEPFTVILGVLTTLSIIWNEKIANKDNNQTSGKTLVNRKKDQINKILDEHYGPNSYQYKEFQLSLSQKLNCDRKNFIDGFEKKFRGHNKYPNHLNWFFILHGAEHQKPHSLIERMIIGHERDNPSNVKWPQKLTPRDGERLSFFDLPITQDIEDSKFKFQEKVFPQIVETNKAIYSLDDYSNSPYANFKYMVIPFRIKSKDWKNFTPDFLKWIVEKYCPIDDYNQSKLIFFLCIDWVRPKPKFWQKKITTNHEKQIRIALDKFNNEMQAVVFFKEEVTNVTGSDLRDCLSFIKEESVLQSIISTILSKNEAGLKQALSPLTIDETIPIDMHWVETFIDHIVQLHKPNSEETIKHITT